MCGSWTRIGGYLIQWVRGRGWVLCSLDGWVEWMSGSVWGYTAIKAWMDMGVSRVQPGVPVVSVVCAVACAVCAVCVCAVCACAVCLRCAWIYLRYACAVPRASLVLVNQQKRANCQEPRVQTVINSGDSAGLSTTHECYRGSVRAHQRDTTPVRLTTPPPNTTRDAHGFSHHFSLDRRRSPTIPLHRPCHQAQPRYKQLAQSPGTIYHHYTKTLSQQHPQCPDDNTRPTTRALHEPLL